MDTSGLRQLNSKNGTFAAVSGTVNCGNARIVSMQVVLDGNSTYEVAVRATTSATGTVGKDSMAACISDNGVWGTIRPSGAGANDWYLAYKTYNGATAATATSANDKYAVERWG
ncbi:MAG: hypothetical protein WC455_11940 [Dehalococcoidia bacterium]|jgi:hypothetical protein